MPKFRIGWIGWYGMMLVVTVALAACAGENLLAGYEASASPSSLSSGQTLPITAHATIGQTTFHLEVAHTPQQQMLGLMFRPTLADDRGMLFPFNPPRRVGFWMKNVPVPLDMIFLRQGVVQYIAASVPPCPQEPCPLYGPKGLVDQVIELRSGRAAELRVQVGDRIPITFLENTTTP